MLTRCATAFALFIIGAICLVLWHGNPHRQPMAAQVHGYNKLTFHEDWSDGTAHIDLNNTKAAGFNFYTNGSFPSLFANGTTWTGGASAPVMRSDMLSVANKVLTISGTQSQNNWQNINTCVWNGFAVSGTSFGGGFYIDIAFQFDPTRLVQLDPGWPAWWFAPKEYLNGSITNTNWVEIDGFEAHTGSGTSLCGNNCNAILTNHYWNVSNGTNDFYSWEMQTNIKPVFGTWDFNELQHYGVLWVTAASNGGTGFITRYLNGVGMTTMTYSATGGTNPALSPGNPNGALSEMDNENFCLYINSGTNVPVKVGTVQVWQK